MSQHDKPTVALMYGELKPHLREFALHCLQSTSRSGLTMALLPFISIQELRKAVVDWEIGKLLDEINETGKGMSAEEEKMHAALLINIKWWVEKLGIPTVSDESMYPFRTTSGDDDGP